MRGKAAADDISPGFLVEFFILIELFPVSFPDLAQDPAWISGSKAPVGDVPGDDAARSDRDVVSDGDPGEDDSIAADPDIVTNSDGLAVFIKGITTVRMNRMAGCVDGYIGGHLAVVADLYLCHIQDRAVVVGKEVFSHFDVGSVITVKGRIDEGILRFPEELPDDFRYAVKIRAVHEIELLQDLPAAGLFFHYTVVGDISEFSVPPFNLIHIISL